MKGRAAFCKQSVRASYRRAGSEVSSIYNKTIVVILFRVVSVLHREIRARAMRGAETSRVLYREELRRAAGERDSLLSQANAEVARIEQLLPGAVQAGLSMVDEVELAVVLPLPLLLPVKVITGAFATVVSTGAISRKLIFL